MAASNTPSILYLITARGGSKGVPGKNLKKIGGHSLIGYKAISAQKSKHCSRLVISTDDPHIQDEARRYNVEVPFTRPQELATDTAKLDDVVLHAMDYFENIENHVFDAIMLLQATAPFTRPEDYNSAKEIYLSQNASLVVGMKQAEVNSIFIGPLREDGRADQIINKFKHKNDLRRQKFTNEFMINGALYLLSWSHMRKTKRIYGDPENTFGYQMDPYHSIDIDTPYDFRLAELYAENGYINVDTWK